MKYGRVGLTLLAAALAGILPSPALADSNARIVRLSYVDGDTQIDNRDGRGFARAFANMPLLPGTQVSTGNDGRAEIEFEDMSTVRLTPETLVQTQSLDLRTSGAKYTLVDLQDGTAYFNIRKLDDDNDFRVDSGRREFIPNRASRFRLRVDRSQVVLAVFSGEVEVIGQGSSLTVRKNETLTLDSEDPARYFLAKGISGDRYDEWDQERDDYRERYARSASYSGYSSAYSYGASDLNYWGSYTYIAGYGYMWRPYYYGVNWNPYSNGGWYWYPGSGWIWVSAYPWGWMPFHYGSWYYISGHGWCWRPGNRWHHWSPVVAVHNPPPGHHSPTPPPSTGGHNPVMVGSGPSTILPSEDPGRRLRGVRDPNVLDKRGRSPVVGGGSGGTGAPGSGGSPASGSGSAGSGFVGSGGGGRPAADTGGNPSGRRREVDLEDAIQNARERRLGGGQAGGVITNSGPGISVSSGGGSGSGVTTGSPASERERIPEPRRQLPPSITRDEPTPGTSSGSSGSRDYRWVGSSSDSGSAASGTDSTPSVGRGRAPEPRREIPREAFVERSGSSSSSSAGSARSSSGWSGGSSAGSGSGGGSAAPSSAPSGSGGGRSSSVGSGSSSGIGSGGGRSSAGSSGSSSSGRSSGGGSGSGAGRSSSGSGSSSGGARSSASTTPK